MTGGYNLNKMVLKLALPGILANITIPLMGMVDLAVAGRLGDASFIAAVAISTMLFDLLYWNMGFLRVGVGGMVAQAYGRRDLRDAMRLLTQGLVTSTSIAFIIWIIQTFFVSAVFYFVEASPEVESLAREYYFIRIWAAPATLSLYVFKGFFIGMQNSISSMIVDLVANLTNIAASIYFALFTPMGFAGIAMGTLVAQYAGALTASLLLVIYYGKLFKYFNFKESFDLERIKKFFSVNVNIFIRSVCFLFIYVSFTILASTYGDLLLAVCTIVLKIMMFYSFFLDGFAYAGQALTGRFIGAGDRKMVVRTVKNVFAWGAAVGAISALVYSIEGETFVRLLTNDAEVVLSCGPHILWLVVMPIVSCTAFTWDGIYIGATATAAIRNSMIWSVLLFFLTYYSLKPLIGVHALWSAFMMHLVVRSLYLTIKSRGEIFILPFAASGNRIRF